MAKLSDETLTIIFYLLRQLAEEIERACEAEWILFDRYGETPRTIGELEELQNARERLDRSYARLNTLLLRVLEAQPIAGNAMLDLLAKAIDNGRANLEAANASIQEIKRGWNLSWPMLKTIDYANDIPILMKKLEYAVSIDCGKLIVS
jgi:hypothetical protein